MLQLNKVQIAAIAVASVLASYAAAGSLAPQQEQMSITDALLEVQYADAAAVDYFLKIEGIEGESTARGHEKWIELQSFSWGVSQTGTLAAGAGSGAAGKVSVQDLSFQKFIDKSSPKLMQACTNGQHIPKVELAVRRSGENQQDFLKLTLENVFISSYSIGGSSGIVPTDSFSLNFSKVTWTYIPQKPDGSPDRPVTGSYDLSKVKK